MPDTLLSIRQLLCQVVRNAHLPEGVQLSFEQIHVPFFVKNHALTQASPNSAAWAPDETPDAIGWKGSCSSVVIERNDFLAEATKPFRVIVSPIPPQGSYGLRKFLLLFLSEKAFHRIDGVAATLLASAHESPDSLRGG